MSGVIEIVVIEANAAVDLGSADWDLNELPHGIQAGANKYGFEKCPVCKSEGHMVPLVSGQKAAFFLFKDQLSVQEYQISGMCQECQDAAFKPHPEDQVVDEVPNSLAEIPITEHDFELLQLIYGISRQAAVLFTYIASHGRPDDPIDCMIGLAKRLDAHLVKYPPVPIELKV